MIIPSLSTTFSKKFFFHCKQSGVGWKCCKNYYLLNIFLTLLHVLWENCPSSHDFHDRIKFDGPRKIWTQLSFFFYFFLFDQSPFTIELYYKRGNYWILPLTSSIVSRGDSTNYASSLWVRVGVNTVLNTYLT